MVYTKTIHVWLIVRESVCSYMD